MKDEFEFVRLVGNERRVASTLKGVSRHWQDDRERFLFISPHDDDVAIGAGLLIQLAKRENVPVHILIATDGSMGYCTDAEKHTIAQVRKKETFECYQILGVPEENIVWLNFPDCQLNNYRGRRTAQPDDKAVINNFTGLQNAFTYYLRKTKPTQCFLPTSNDLHPDHRIIHAEFLISIFHAAGNIWPELGAPLEKTPYVHEMAIYCDFPEPPQLQMRTPVSFLERKLKAIAAFHSQKQISSVIKIIKNAGPEEYIRALEFKLYNPRGYRDLFEEKGTIDFIHR
ncbi:MAG: GlcNAc-PI de-N-acetylase [Planctomycetota bacterium]|nr:MAG: GlcNAc-PI de-N-acetylase [Planctomycetota bacterium]